MRWIDEFLIAIMETRHTIITSMCKEKIGIKKKKKIGISLEIRPEKNNVFVNLK